MAGRTALSIVSIFLAMTAFMLPAYGAADAASSEGLARKPSLCTSGQIVPGSIEVFSNSSVAGEIAGHTVHFKFCPPRASADAGRHGSPTESSKYYIAFLWQDQFSRHNRDEMDITLRDAGGRTWPVDLTKASGWRYFYHYDGYNEAAIEIPPFLYRKEQAGGYSPVDLWFQVPVAAGISNGRVGPHRWGVAFYQGSVNNCGTSIDWVEKVLVPAAIDMSQPQIHVNDTSGSASSRTVLYGSGFEPFALLSSLTMGGLDIRLDRDRPIFTDDNGQFFLNIFVPPLDVGLTKIEVTVGEKTVSTGFTVTYGSPGTFFDRGLLVERPDQALGPNLATVFHYELRSGQWVFYDPEISPRKNTLQWLVDGECYWILVKDPVEVEVSETLLTLTCSSDGNCWNQVVWWN